MRSIDVLTRRAHRQYGALSVRQAHGMGLTQDQIDSMVAIGFVRRPTRGVLVVAGSPDTWQQRTMVALLARPEAVASHVTAVALHGIGRPPPVPHILVPRGRSTRLPVAKVHRGPLRPGDRVTVDGIACTSPTRTIVDMASLVSRHELAAMVDDSFCRDLSCVEAVYRTLVRLGRRGRSGMALLEEVLAAWTPGIKPGSPAEMRLLRLISEWGWEPPERQVDVYAADGTFIGRLDLAWVRRCTGLEYDSDRFHNPRRWEADEARYAAFRAAGWTVRSVGKPDLMPSSDLRTRLDAMLRASAAA